MKLRGSFLLTSALKQMKSWKFNVDTKKRNISSNAQSDCELKINYLTIGEIHTYLCHQVKYSLIFALWY